MLGRLTAACFISTLTAGLLALAPAPAAHGKLRMHSASEQRTSYSLTTARCPVCTQAQMDRWNFVTDQQLGVDGIDPVGPYAGFWPAERNKADFGAGDPYGTDNIWFPQSVVKQTLCGTLDHFNFFDGSGEEADWNNFIRPAPAFQRLGAEVDKRYGATGDWHTDSAGRFLMEAEITPDEHFYENQWFSKSRDTSALEGHQMCAYGPWIADKPHDYRPEIHPSEQLWWRSGDSGYALLLQDDSNRFDVRDDYDFDGDPTPSWWRAWSRSPRTGRFSIAFSVSRGSPAEIALSQEAVRDNVLRNSADIDDGTRHALVYNGRALLAVDEGVIPDSYVRVGFDRVCRDASDTRLYGFVTLRSKVGVNDRGGEGYHLLKFTQQRLEGPQYPPLDPLEVAPATVRARVVREWIRTVTVNGRPELVADLRLSAARTRSGPTTHLAFERSSLRAPRRFPSTRTRRSPSGRTLQLTVPVTQAARLETRMQSGFSVALQVPQVAPAPNLIAVGATSATSPGDWARLGTAAGGAPGDSAPPVDVQRVQRLRLRGSAAYAAVRDGAVSREEDSPVAEHIEEALRSRRETMKVFGRTTPASLAWAFGAVDLQTGRAVTVRVNQAPGAGEIGVRTVGRGIRSTATVTFPSTGLYEVSAGLGMQDRYGKTGRQSLVVSNLLLTGKERTAFRVGLLRAAALLVAGSPDELVSQALADPSIGEQARSQQARAVRALAADIARDRQVSLADLRALVRAAQLWAATPAPPAT